MCGELQTQGMPGGWSPWFFFLPHMHQIWNEEAATWKCQWAQTHKALMKTAVIFKDQKRNNPVSAMEKYENI